MNKSKVLGMLLGLHAGDSLGATLEFGQDVPDLSHTEIIGGGSFDWKPGQATDDTDLMLALLRSIKSTKSVSLVDFKSELIKWYNTDPRDIGSTTNAAIERMLTGSLKGGSQESASEANGSLMRVAPLALLDWSPNLNVIVQDCNEMTHGNPTCVFADQIYITMLKHALDGDNQKFLINIAELACAGTTLNRVLTDVAWDRLPTSGWVIDTFGAVVWALRHCNSFEDALIKVVNRGDDSDTTGAVVGAMFGAIYGVEAIPQRWLGKLERAEEIKMELNRIFGDSV